MNEGIENGRFVSIYEKVIPAIVIVLRGNSTTAAV